MTKRPLVLLLWTLVWLMLPSPGRAANETRYVACDGSDTNTGLSSGAPKLTIQSAMNASSGSGNTFDVSGDCEYRGNGRLIDTSYAGTSGAYNVIRWWNRTGTQTRPPLFTNLQPVTGFVNTALPPNVWCAPWHDAGVPRTPRAMVLRDRLLQGTTAHGATCTLEYDGTCRNGTGFHPNRAQDFFINGTSTPSSITQLDADGEYFMDAANDRLCVYSTSDPDTRYTQPGYEALVNANGTTPLALIEHSYWRLENIAIAGCNDFCLAASPPNTTPLEGFQFLNGRMSFSEHRAQVSGNDGGSIMQLATVAGETVTGALIKGNVFHDTGRGFSSNSGNGTVEATYEDNEWFNAFNHGATSANHNGNGPRNLVFRRMNIHDMCDQFFGSDPGTETVPRTDNAIITMSDIAITRPVLPGDPRRGPGAECSQLSTLEAIEDSERYTLTGTRILASGYTRGIDLTNANNITSCTHCTIVDNIEHGIRLGNGVDFTLNNSIVAGNGTSTIGASSYQVGCTVNPCSSNSWPGGDTAQTENFYFRDDGSTTGDIFRVNGTTPQTLTEWRGNTWVSGDDSSEVIASNPVPNAASLDFTPPAGSPVLGCTTTGPHVGGTAECGAIEVPELGTCSVTGNLLRCNVSTLNNVPLAVVSGLTPRVGGTARAATQHAVSGTQFTATISGAAITGGQVVTLDVAYGNVQAQTAFSRYITARMHAVTGYPVTNLNTAVPGACTLYASPTGSGTTCSQGSPCLVASAWASLDPGETLCLNDGTYTGANSMIVPTVSGTAGNPITIRALNDGAVLIDGQGARIPMDIDTRNYLTVEGINLRNSNTDVVQIDTADNIIVRRSIAWDALDTGNSKPWAIITSTNVLLEDVGAFGTGRKGIEVFRSTDVTLRRVFARWDGSNSTSDPRMAIASLYRSYRVRVENAVALWVGNQHQATWNDGDPEGALGSDSLEPLDNVLQYDSYHSVHGTILIAPSTASTTITPFQNMRIVQVDQSLVEDTVSYVGVPTWTATEPFRLANCSQADNGATPEPNDGCATIDGTPESLVARNLTSIGPVASVFESHWTVTNHEYATTVGGVSSIYTGATGATVCTRYVDGVLTTTPLWPWPMSARILAATTLDGAEVTDVDATIEAIFGVVPSQCSTTPSPGEVFYVDASAGSDSNTCAQAESPSAPRQTVASGLSCVGPGDTLRLRDDQVFRVTSELLLQHPDVRIERYGNGTRGAVLTHFSLVTGSWTTTGTANVWERTGFPNNIQRMLVVARDDSTGPLAEITSPVAKTQNYWYGTETQWAHNGTCTPASLTSNYDFCWRDSTDSILMYYNGGNPSTITQPGIEVIHMASRPESLLRITGANTVIDGINVLGCAERCVWYRQGSGGSRYLGPAEIGYSRFRDPDVWGAGSEGAAVVEIAPDNAASLSDIQFTGGVFLHDCGRDCYRLATFPATGNGTRSNMVLRDITLARGFSHPAINACDGGNGTTTGAVFDRLTTWDVCSPVLAYSGCLTNTDITWSSLYGHSLVLQSDQRVPLQTGEPNECNANNYYLFSNGQAGVSTTDRDVMTRSILADADIAFRMSGPDSFLALERSLILGNSEQGVSVNGNGGSLQVIDSIIAGNGDGNTATASNGNVVCILGVCDTFLWDIEDSTIDNGANTSVAYLDGASRTISQLNTIDTSLGNQDVAPGLTLPNPRHSITVGSLQVAQGNAASEDGPLVGFGLSCTTLNATTLRITAGTTDVPVITTAARFTPLVDGAGRTATTCTVTGDTQVDCAVSGEAMVGGQDIDLTASLGAVESVCVVGDRTGPCFRQASYATTALQCGNTLAGGGSSTPVYSMPTWQVYPSHCNAATTSYCRPYGPEKVAPCLTPTARFTLATAIEVEEANALAQQYRLRCRYIPVATGVPGSWELITQTQAASRVATTGNRGVVDDQACASSVLDSSEGLCYYVEANGERTLSLGVSEGQRLTVLWSLQLDPTPGNLLPGDRVQCEPALPDGTPIAGDPPFELTISTLPQSVTYR